MAQKPTIDQEPILLGNGTAYLPGSKSAIFTGETSKNMFAKPDVNPITLPASDKDKKTYRGIVPWGETNDLPQQINAKAYKTPVITSGMLFNVSLSYGQGIVPVTYEFNAKGDRISKPVYDNADINEFFENNDINGYFLEQLTDMNFHFNVFPEIIINRESSPKVVSLRSKEATFSRWEEMNPETGIIENHFYSAYWEKGTPARKDIVVTPVLDPYTPLADLRNRVKEKKDGFRFIIPINFPTPGRLYYQKPYWFSIIESGWYDFALKIPEFKNALLQNGMTIKYLIEFHPNYFKDLFQREGITDKKLQEKREKKEYTDIDKFLADSKNTGKSMVSFYRISPDGTKEFQNVKITAIDSKFKGGEYLEDSEEVSNILSYGMGVHPSVIGSSPGKSKTINGTEARELFLIKQALIKPFRDRLLRPLYLIKAFNNWPKDIFFEISDIQLTTLDKNPSGTTSTITDTAPTN